MSHSEPRGEPVVELRDVSFGRRGVPILENVDFTLQASDYVGLIGPNGGGKTTLLKLILGLLRPDRGMVRVLGGTPEQARGQVGYVPQYARFEADFPIRVLDVVLMGRLGRRRSLPGWVLPWSQEDRGVARDCLERVAMLEHAHRQIGGLSGGEVQRVLFARALAGEPRILLLDEPTAGIDSRVGRDIYELLEELSQRMTVILVTHDIGVISSYVKTVACLNRKLHYHHSKEIPPEVLESVYGCPVELLAHGHAHRVYASHGEGARES